MDQKTAFEVLKTGSNVFLTGPAGSGKTYLLNQFINYLKKERIGVAVTASTGIAATHMNGMTIHAWSGMGIKDNITKHDLEKISRNSRIERRVLSAEVLIIDEISMLDARQLENVNRICKKIKKPFFPFGGLQVILCGDFFQLPPVSRNSAEKSKFAFSSIVWREADIKICYLDEQHRQQDDRILRVLNDIRQCRVSEKTSEIISSRRGKEVSGNFQPAKLFTHNADVDAINDLELGKIKEKSIAYKMFSDGKKSLTQYLKKNCLAPETLKLKKGARVMFVKNNFDEGYVNGTMGQIIGFEKENKMPIVRIFQGKEISVRPALWEIEENNITLAKIRQIPLRLAWAITVHKSQGMSLDAAEIDLSRSFEPGMGYVALSRVRTLDGIKLLGINEMSLEINKEVFELDKQLIELSQKLAEEIENSNWLKKKTKSRKNTSSANPAQSGRD